MPITTQRVHEITCDNARCPGNELDPAERTGWTFVTSEVYGKPTQQHVYCSADCAAADAAEAFLPKEEAGAMPIEPTP